jgi:hypothetical protein
VASWNLDESWERNGIWWLPSHPGDQVAGSLTYSRAEGLRLALIGVFDNDALPRGLMWFGGPTVRRPVIHGLTPGTLFTLIDCPQVSANVSAPGYTSEVYRPRFAVTDAHLGEDDLVFDEVHLGLSHLDNWVTRSGITMSFHRTADDVFERLEFNYVQPGEYSAPNLTVGSVALAFPYTFSGPVAGTHSARLDESPEWAVTLAEAVDVATVFHRIVAPLTNLLTLGTDQPSQVDAVYLKSPHTEVRDGRRDRLTLYYRASHSFAGSSSRVDQDDMLFTLTDAETVGFYSLLDRWFTVATDLEHACNLFFSAHYLTDLPVELRFLNVVRAAEVYHRVRYATTALAPEDHAAMVDRIVSRFDGDDRVWLEGQLAYSNEARLIQRLRELIDFVGSALTPALVQGLARRVADSRNYLTHYDEGLHGRASHGVDLYRLSEALVLLLQACFLRELGFDEATSAALIQRNRRFTYLTRAYQ